MIKAEHKKWARLIFNPYINRLLRKNFSHFYMVNNIPEINQDKPLIITPNHISWWDGFFIDYVSRKFIKRKIHLMMLESSLRKYKFFKKVGAYSIQPQNNVSVRHTISYTKDVLTDTNNFVVTYPQGEIEPFEKRQLNIKEGLKLLIYSGEEIIIPAAFKIQYYNEKYPSVICRFGKQLSGNDVKNNFELFRTKFTENLDMLRHCAYKEEFYKDLFTV